VSVRAGKDGRPLIVGSNSGGRREADSRDFRCPAKPASYEVEAVREQWLVEDRWWTSRPIRRRYFELTTAEGANRVVFRDLDSGRWFTQRGA
jgi:hypothetical protein